MRILSHESQSFGKGIGKSIAEWSRILRQAVGKEVLDLMFTENRFHGVTRIYRKYILSDKGNNFLKTPIDIFVKGPYDEAATGKTGRGESSRCRGKQYMPLLRSALTSSKNWRTMESEDDYMYPGFGIFPEKFVFCEDVSKFQNGDNNLDMLVKDCELSSPQSNSSPQVIEVDGQKTEVIVRRFGCAGVKVCSAPNCDYTVSTSQRINRRRVHKNTHGLQKSEQCPVNIIHVKPKAEDDGRRWVGTLTLQEATPRHSHAKPSPRKLPISVVKDLQQAVLLDPSKKAKDLQKSIPS